MGIDDRFRWRSQEPAGGERALPPSGPCSSRWRTGQQKCFRSPGAAEMGYDLLATRARPHVARTASWYRKCRSCKKAGEPDRSHENHQIRWSLTRRASRLATDEGKIARGVANGVTCIKRWRAHAPWKRAGRCGRASGRSARCKMLSGEMICLTSRYRAGLAS